LIYRINCAIIPISVMVPLMYILAPIKTMIKLLAPISKIIKGPINALVYAKRINLVLLSVVASSYEAFSLFSKVHALITRIPEKISCENDDNFDKFCWYAKLRLLISLLNLYIKIAKNGTGINEYQVSVGEMIYICTITTAILKTVLIEYITASPTYWRTFATSSEILLIKSPVRWRL